MNFAELNQKLAAAGAPPVYFARYSPRESPREYAEGDWVHGAISIVDRGSYLAWGTSERSEFTESRERFATESEMFDFLLEELTTPLPPPVKMTLDEIEFAKGGLERAEEWMAARRRERETDGAS